MLSCISIRLLYKCILFSFKYCLSYEDILKTVGLRYKQCVLSITHTTINTSLWLNADLSSRGKHSNVNRDVIFMFVAGIVTNYRAKLLFICLGLFF